MLQTHMVQYEDRDIFMSREIQKELMERLQTDRLDVPQVFADGQHLGVCDTALTVIVANMHAHDSTHT